MPPEKDKNSTRVVNENESHHLPISSPDAFATDPLKISCSLTEEEDSTSDCPKDSKSMCKISIEPSHTKRQKTIMQEKQQDAFTFSQTIVSIMICIVCTAFSMEFSIRFPHFLSTAARMTFSHAWYQYDPSKTFFDTTILTYGTDYIIFILMVYASYQCAFAGSTATHTTKTTTGTNHNHNHGDRSRPLRLRAAALFACYAISVLAGGYAHQTFLTFEDLQTSSFRILWTVCTGSVTLAGGFMGMCASEICRTFLHDLASISTDDEKRKHSCITLWSVPIIQDSWWILYGLYMTLYCIAGGISCYRPAADIFLAGVTQFVPTFYCELIMWSRLWKDGDSWLPTIPKSTRYIFYLGFMLNAPLLPLYPYLIHHTTLTLGAVNALLHLNLTISWGMQAMSLYQICIILNRHDMNSGEVTTKTK